jgi:hypothetical protein
MQMRKLYFFKSEVRIQWPQEAGLGKGRDVGVISLLVERNVTVFIIRGNHNLL